MRPKKNNFGNDNMIAASGEPRWSDNGIDGIFYFYFSIWGFRMEGRSSCHALVIFYVLFLGVYSSFFLVLMLDFSLMHLMCHVPEYLLLEMDIREERMVGSSLHAVIRH